MQQIGLRVLYKSPDLLCLEGILRPIHHPRDGRTEIFYEGCPDRTGRYGPRNGNQAFHKTTPICAGENPGRLCKGLTDSHCAAEVEDHAIVYPACRIRDAPGRVPEIIPRFTVSVSCESVPDAGVWNRIVFFQVSTVFRVDFFCRSKQKVRAVA